MESFRGEPAKLAHKYKNELLANEVAILPYYVANLNIEATYAAISGQYAEYPNLCFVDTLDNVAALGIRAGHQHDMFAAVSDENIERVKRQNEKTISVIIGNPPYNANQQNENDNNKNRTYKRIDESIKTTYVANSTAQKTKVYDMYSRFFRWATDRLGDEGVIAFITNRSFIDSRTFDGFRSEVVRVFDDIYVVDLGGDVRANPKLSGTTHNVFGIQTGVAITFIVKRKSKAKEKPPAKIHYARRPEMERAEDKLAFLAEADLSTMALESITPSKRGNWINQVENEWDDLLPIADKKVKAAKGRGQDRAIFKLFSAGVVTARDEWVLGQNRNAIIAKSKFLLENYNSERRRWKERNCKVDVSDFVDRIIKWTSELENHLVRDTKLKWDSGNIRDTSYRPFTKLDHYHAPTVTHRIYQNSNIFPKPDSKNVVIAFLSIISAWPLSTLATDHLADYCFLKQGNGATQCLPRYRYSASGERVDNITDWALRKFRDQYGKIAPSSSVGSSPESPVKATGGSGGDPSGEGRNNGGGADEGAAKPRTITKDDIFHYCYAVLHDPIYRETYAINLKREFPRIPYYPNFAQWAAWGEALMALHIGYEEVEPWPLDQLDEPHNRAEGCAPKAMLRSDHENGTIRLDADTQLTGVPASAWHYKLGNRTAIDWVLDQHKEKKPRDPTIREKFNTYRFADYKDKVIDLLGRVTRVSVETVAITQEMQALNRDGWEDL